MPTVEWNARTWNLEYAWKNGGDEWSVAWGSAANQWYWALLPRLAAFLPARRILEIGPGHGRWSQFLLAHCEQLMLVDLSATCIETCRRRFKDRDNITYAVNDGASLDSVRDGSIDLAFSFDSLVHAEQDVLAQYLSELGRTLAPDGVAFLHHSNLGTFRYFHWLRQLESLVKPPGSVHDVALAVAGDGNGHRRVRAWFSDALMAMRLVDRTHMRALSVSAESVRQVGENAGLRCIGQEVFRWGRSRRPIDCISIFGRGNDKRYVKIENRNFMLDAERARRVAQVYSLGERPG